MCAATYKLLVQLGPPDKVILDSTAVKCNKLYCILRLKLSILFIKIDENVFVGSPIHGRL